MVFICHLQVKVDADSVNRVRNLYAPPDDPGFELVPDIFGHYASQIYEAIGKPTLNSDNIWLIYNEILKHLEAMQDNVDAADYIDALEEWTVNQELQAAGDDGDVQLEMHYPLIGGKDLLGGSGENILDNYLGGVNGGLGPGE